MTLNLGVYEPIVDPKGCPILVQVTIFYYLHLTIKLIFFSKFLRLWKFIPLFWTLILFVKSSKSYLNLFEYSVVPSHLTSIQWFFVKQVKESGKKSRLTCRDLWSILVTDFSSLQRRSMTQLQFSMQAAPLRCLDWSFRKTFGTIFKLRPGGTLMCVVKYYSIVLVGIF